MTYNLLRTIGHGSIHELILTNLDSAQNYRFKMNSTNRDGTSVWSNWVEWGAERLDLTSFFLTYGAGIARYGVDAEDPWPGVWVARMKSGVLTVEQFSNSWDGSDAAAPLATVLPALDQMGRIADSQSVLTLYQVYTDFPGNFGGHLGGRPFLVLKYSDTVTLTTPTGGHPPILIAIYEDPSGNGFTYTQVEVEGIDPIDFLIMEDGLLLVKYPAGAGSQWKIRVLERPARFTNYAYPLTQETTLDNLYGADTVIPYLMNQYPLILQTDSVVAGDTMSVTSTTYGIDAGWAVNTIDVISPSMHTATVLLTGTTPDSVSVLLTPHFSTYVNIVISSLSSNTITEVDTDVYTNVAHWAGWFVYKERLLIYGKSGTEVETAPDTPHVDPSAVVNIHRMDLTQNTGIADFSDVGPNLLIFTNDSVAAYQGIASIYIGTLANTNGNVVILNDGSVVVYSYPSSLGLHAEYIWQ